MFKGFTEVDIDILNNAWWDDAFQFGVIGDTSWSFIGVSFLLDVKVTKSSITPALSLSTTAGSIVVDDPVQRILHFMVDDNTIRSSLAPTGGGGPDGKYYYDLLMVNNSTGQRDVLMRGLLDVGQGVTLED